MVNNSFARDSEHKTMVELNIPIEVANDNYIKVYKVLDGDKVAKYFERQDTPRDQKPVYENGELKVKPVFLGEWRDKTEQYLAEQEAKKAQLKEDKKKGIVNRSGRARTREEIKEEELRNAQRLLAELYLNGGIEK